MTLLTAETEKLLRCPRCRSGLSRQNAGFTCTNGECARRYPLTAQGIPILIDEDASVFSIAAFERQEPTFFHDLRGAARVLKKLVPEITNLRSKTNYETLRARLLATSAAPRVLVLGGSILGFGMEALDAAPIELVESDVALGPRAKLICDAHSIPFADGSFDCVVAQAVLEHVVDPFRCVAENHRVLKPDGLDYAETPFMQQVHGGAYDFLRFSYLAYLRLFRNFEMLECAPVAGPAVALAWSWEFFLLSFARSRRMRYLAKAFARFTAFPLKWFDYLLIDRPAAYDAASGFFFLGRRNEKAVADRDLLNMYKGGGDSR